MAGWEDTIQDAPAAAGWESTIQDTADHSLLGAAKAAGRGVVAAANALGTKPLYEIAYDNLVQPAVDTYNAHRGAGDNMLQSALAAGARGTGDLARTGENLIAPATAPVNTYFDSRNRGSDVGDALRDARNVGVIQAGAGALGQMAGAAAPMVGKVADVVADRLPTAIGTAVGHHFGGLPGAVMGSLAGDAIKGLRAGAKDVSVAAAPIPSPVAGTTANAFSTGWSQGPATPVAAPVATQPFSPGWRAATSPPSAPAASLGDTVVAAARTQGPQAAAVAHYLASQRDPAYAAAHQKKDK